MTFTLLWKELREHRAIWLTMVVLTSLLGLGIAKLNMDPTSATTVAPLTILALAGTYGVVCGAMLLAGEHEGGTMVFLDTFCGRRGALWLGKFLIGILLVLTQASAVAAILYFAEQPVPGWAPGIAGIDRGMRGLVPFGRGGPELWFAILPLVTLEAYAWGLFGSALTRRVLAAAAIGVAAATPIWLFSIFAPVVVFLSIRIAAMVITLVISGAVFVSVTGETTPSAPLEPEPRRRRRYEGWDEDGQSDWYGEYDDRYDRPYGGNRYGERDHERRGGRWAPEPDLEAAPLAVVAPVDEDEDIPAAELIAEPPPLPPTRSTRREEYAEASSSFHVLWWLCWRQAWALLLCLCGAALIAGMVLPVNGQVLWPAATMLLGVACGTAAFGAEQRDLSYQFLSTQHLPLHGIWRFKLVFWFVLSSLTLLTLLLGGLLMLGLRALTRPGGAPAPAFDFSFGALPSLTGPVIFGSVFLIYGFCIGSVFVWLCRKLILALLLSTLSGAAAIALWLPCLLTGGMGGWQVWAPPLALLAATYSLVRAWAGGRIKERRPMAALIGFAALGLAWVGFNYLYRAWEAPNVGPPLDRAAFRAALQTAQDNLAGRKMQDAISEFEAAPGGDVWLARLDEALPMPPGVIEGPSAEGQDPILRHLPSCGEMTDQLLRHAQAKQRLGRSPEAFHHLKQALLLSRALRNKAPRLSYVAGVDVERRAFDGLDDLLPQAVTDAAFLKTVLKELDRHAAATPPAFDCLQTECFRAGGLIENPAAWSFSSRAGVRQAPDKWLVGGIALSLNLPWEAERKTRIWQTVWAGLFRAIETPYWELPDGVAAGAETEATRRVLNGWIPPADAPAAGDRLARLLDSSWLADDRLYAAVVPLRDAALRSRWRLDAHRLAVALSLYRREEGKHAAKLADLVPKYLKEIPVDPYSGTPFQMRLSANENIEGVGAVPAGRLILWSPGPDRTDDGGRAQGERLPAERWPSGRFDLILVVPG